MKYLNSVLDYLEYLGYLDYVLYFDEQNVAHFITQASEIFERMHCSYRSCALTIFGMTWKYQIARVNSDTAIN